MQKFRKKQGEAPNPCSRQQAIKGCRCSLIYLFGEKPGVFLKQPRSYSDRTSIM